MLITGQNMFTYFLDEINKEQTGTCTPQEFNRLINDVQLDCVKDKYSEVELTQKRVDDLRVLECRDVLPNVGMNVPGQEIFNLPYSDTSFVTTPGNPNGDNHGYMFLLNCAFQIQYVNDDCGNTGLSVYKNGKPRFLMSRRMTADKEYAIENDPYNKPTNKRLYHKLLGKTIRIITGTESFGVQCAIDYLRYPREINVPVPGALVDIGCELPLHVRKEILNIAIRRKLGIYESPRYQQKIVEDSQSIT